MKRRRREPYAWLEKRVGRHSVFLVGSRTNRRIAYRVTVSTPSFSDGPVAQCNCLAGQHSYDGPARCFHAKRALASWRRRGGLA